MVALICADSNTLTHLPTHLSIDLRRGLVEYLGEKVGTGFLCLRCNGRGRNFNSLPAVRAHMISKGHHTMGYDEAEMSEYADFYDYRPSYPDYVERMEAKRLAREERRARRAERKAAQETEAAASEATTADVVVVEDDGDEEYEDVSDDDEDASGTDEDEGDMDVVLQRHRPVVADDGLEVVLPNGSRLGHRSLRTYYRQQFAPEDTRDCVLVNRMAARQRVLGWARPARPGEALPVTALQKKDQRDRRHWQQYHAAKVGIKHNMLQHHFRCQVDF